MKPLIQWILYSLPTTLGYSAECFGFPKLAKAMFSPCAKAGYPPAMFHLGWLMTDFMNVDCDVETGKKWIQKAAYKGHRQSQEWLKKYGDLDDEHSTPLRELINSIQPPHWRLWKSLRPVIWLALIIVITVKLTQY